MNSNQCSFCGKKRKEVEILISGNEGFICENCIEQAHAIIMENTPSSGFSAAESISDLQKPKEIKSFLDQYVIGQDQAKNSFQSRFTIIIKDFYTPKMKTVRLKSRNPISS